MKIETWEQQRVRLERLATTGSYVHADRAAVREALRRADELTAAEDARENIISGTSNRTAPESPCATEWERDDQQGGRYCHQCDRRPKGGRCVALAPATNEDRELWAKAPARPDLYLLLADWACEPGETKRLGKLLRALVDRAEWRRAAAEENPNDGR